MADNILEQSRPNEDYVRTFPRYFEEFQSSTGEVFGASFMDSFTFPGSLASVARQVDYAEKNGALPRFGSQRVLSQFLTVDEANAQAKPYGLKFDEPIREDALAARIDRQKDVLRRESVIARAPNALGRDASVVGGMLLGAIADPANIALSMLPVVGEARFAMMAKNLGGVGRARLATGAIEGAVGNALFEPAALLIARDEQQDYNMWDSLTNIALGGVVGGGLHFTGGYVKDRVFGRAMDNAVPDRISSAHPLTREHALRTSVSDMAEGRWVDVGPHYQIDERIGREMSVPISLQDYSFKGRGASQDTYLKFQKRFDGNAALIEEATFESRAKADAYIREKAKDIGISRGVFFIERGDDGVSVLRGHDTITPEVDEVGSVREFKSHAEAKKYTDAKNLESKGEWTGYAVSLNPKKGKGTQRHIVVGGKGMTKDLARRIKDKPEMVTFMGRQTIPERRLERVADFKEVAQKFSEEKNQPSALTRDMRSDFPTQNAINEKSISDDIAALEGAISEAQEGINEFSPMIELMDGDVKKALGLDEIESELRALDAEAKDAAKISDAIRTFTNCMARG